MDKPQLIQVEIFGQTYRVQAGTDPGYIEQLAAHVDREMLAISRQAGAVDSLRVAVLAALNISDQYFRLRDKQGEAGDRLGERAARLADELQAVLDE